MFISAASRVLLSIRSKRQTGMPAGKVESAYEEFEDNEGGIMG